MSLPVKFGYTVDVLTPMGIKDIIAHARLAEKYGFDTLWFSDHIVIFPPVPSSEFAQLRSGCPDAWAVLAAIATQTKRLRLASAVSDPYRRHPSLIAQTVATVDRISEGRAILGIGAGEAMNLTPFGIRWDRPLSGLREAILIVRGLWTSTLEDKVNFEGKVFHLRNGFTYVKPVQDPYPPIYVGALGEKTRRIAGELADGWLPWMESPETYRRHLRDVEAGARKVGRNPEEIDSVVNLYTAISADREEAKRSIEIAKIGIVLNGQEILSSAGSHLQIPRELTVQRVLTEPHESRVFADLLAQVPTEVMDMANVAYGRIDDCIEKIEEYIDAGVRQISIFNRGPDAGYTLRMYGEKIMPYFKEQSG